MLHDPLADALSTLKNDERVGKRSCITPASKTITEVFKVMQSSGYIGAYEYIEDGRGGKYKVALTGKMIDCNVIKPRFSVRADEFEKWEKRFLPARKFGILILSTPKGIMDHNKAKQLNIGGKLVAFAY